jgi:heme-degrading monooxygenase HmoA
VEIVHARSTTIQAQVSSIDAGIAHVRDEVLPALMNVPGCVGLSLLVDRQTGRCIATTAWDSESAMRASESQVRPVRDQAAQMFGGGTAQVDEWEIAALHRDHQTPDGACARVTWLDVPPADADRGIDMFRSMLPTIEMLQGFSSASLLVNRTYGRAVVSVTFDSREAMERTRAQASGIRSSVAEQAGGAVGEVAEFELAVAHLRVPEMA